MSRWILPAPKKNLCHNFHQHSRYLLVLAKQFNCTYDHKYRTSLMRSEKKKKEQFNSNRSNAFDIQDQVLSVFQHTSTNCSSTNWEAA